MSKNVLLLGGAGFIGFNIARYLAENRDYKLTIADNFARGKQDDYFTELVNKHNIRVVAGDFTDPVTFNQLDEAYDQVYMLASVVGVDNANSIPHEIIRINTALIFNTLEWVRRSKVGKVLFTSTSECYAGTIEAFGYVTPTPEEVPLCIQDIGHPRFTYAVTKMLGESGFLSNDGFSAAFDSSGSAGFDRDGFNQHAITGRTGFAASKTIRISLSGSYSNYQTDIDASAYTDDRDFTSESNNIQFGGGLLHHFSNGSIHLNYNYNRIERSYLDDSSHKSNLFAFYSKSNYIGRTHYAELYGNWRMSQWEILAGTDFRSNNTDQWYWSTGIFGPFNQPVLNARAKQISPYASVIYKGKGLNVELGGRFNEHSAYGSNFTFTFNPSFLVKNKAKVFANLYSAFKAPTLYQLFDAYAGNASLLPEKGIIGEAGAELLSGKPISARIVGFYRKTTDAIVYTFNPTVFQSKYLNASKQINNGIEAELSYAKNIYSISANYTYTNGKTTSLYDGTGSPLGKDTSYYNLYRIPKHAFNLTAGIRFSKDFFVSTHFRSISKREEFIYGSSPETIDGYAIVDLYGEYKFGNAIRVFVDLKNITNKVYFDIPGYNARKFNFITGLSFQL